ncbi:MAG: class I SAM-dependent methyltransferase [Chloroflexota bacterium]
MDEPIKQQIRDLVLDEPTFVRLTLNGRLHGEDGAWRRIVVRPVQLQGQRHLQFSYFDAKRDITKNYAGRAAEAQLATVLSLPCRSLSVQSKAQTLNVQITKRGKAVVHHGPVRPDERPPDLGHNRRKDLPLPADRPDPVLQALGIMNRQGQVKPGMQGKFTQVNEFLKLLEHTGALETLGDERERRNGRLNIVDCASGSSYLSFATYHYLHDVRGIPTSLAGVDVNEALVEKSNALARGLGFPDVRFHTSSIIEYQPESPPDIVLALHACDTATDEAIARGISWGARLILCVPCCHHHLNEQLGSVEPFGPVVRHGILKQRLADILTDAFRALVLRLAGYETDVVEFVSTEHSGRNLLIRAVKRSAHGGAKLAQEYDALKRFWGVTPYLETLLGPDFIPGAAGSPGDAALSG